MIILLGVPIVLLKYTSLLIFQGVASLERLPLRVVYVGDKKGYYEAHLPKSTYVPFEEIERYVTQEGKNCEIVFYSEYPTHSEPGLAVHKLKTLGFKVWAYEEGVLGWYQKGYPLEGQGSYE